jgi:hypothetical protein
MDFKPGQIYKYPLDRSISFGGSTANGKQTYSDADIGLTFGDPEVSNKKVYLRVVSFDGDFMLADFYQDADCKIDANYFTNAVGHEVRRPAWDRLEPASLKAATKEGGVMRKVWFFRECYNYWDSNLKTTCEPLQDFISIWTEKPEITVYEYDDSSPTAWVVCDDAYRHPKKHRTWDKDKISPTAPITPTLRALLLSLKPGDCKSITLSDSHLGQLFVAEFTGELYEGTR